MAAQPGQWKRRILLPIWAIRILAMLFMCLAFGISIKLAKDSGSQLVIGFVSGCSSVYTSS
jgi:Na+/H+-dicarboxylate symporter